MSGSYSRCLSILPNGRKCQRKRGHFNGECEAAVALQRERSGDPETVAARMLEVGLSIVDAARRSGIAYATLRDAIRAAEDDDTAHEHYGLGRECSAAIGKFAERVANAALNSERNARLLFDTKKQLADSGAYDTSTAVSDSELWINLGLQIFGSKDSGDTNDAENAEDDSAEPDSVSLTAEAEAD